MTFEQFNFCLNTVKKGDSLIIGYSDSYKNEYNNCVNVTREDISYITELLKTPKKVKKVCDQGFIIETEEEPILIRGHKNKFYDEYGNKVEIE
mgnify:CR=1 FL=1